MPAGTVVVVVVVADYMVVREVVDIEKPHRHRQEYEKRMIQLAGGSLLYRDVVASVVSTALIVVWVGSFVRVEHRAVPSVDDRSARNHRPMMRVMARSLVPMPTVQYVHSSSRDLRRPHLGLVGAGVWVATSWKRGVFGCCQSKNWPGYHPVVGVMLTSLTLMLRAMSHLAFGSVVASSLSSIGSDRDSRTGDSSSQARIEESNHSSRTRGSD